LIYDAIRKQNLAFTFVQAINNPRQLLCDGAQRLPKRKQMVPTAKQKTVPK
jgi:hypothetical protein